jgi:hypothetical protein
LIQPRKTRNTRKGTLSTFIFYRTFFCQSFDAVVGKECTVKNETLAKTFGTSNIEKIAQTLDTNDGKKIA